MFSDLAQTTIAKQMLFKTLRFSIILLPILLVGCLQNTPAASAREVKERCYEITKLVQRGSVVRIVNGYGEFVRDDYSNVTYGPDTYNYTSCVKDAASFGVVGGFGNGASSIGLNYNLKFNDFVSARAVGLYKGESIDTSLALTTEINFGAADIFVGGGYNYNIAIGNKPVSTNNNSNYYFLTTGVDYRIAPQIDLNATIRIPVGGGSNGVSYLAGASWNF
jgi:hypothetical protein